jgi:hypothetical protein
MENHATMPSLRRSGFKARTFRGIFLLKEALKSFS